LFAILFFLFFHEFSLRFSYPSYGGGYSSSHGGGGYRGGYPSYGPYGYGTGYSQVEHKVKDDDKSGYPVHHEDKKPHDKNDHRDG
jgi:hypothetical protein